MIGKGIVKPSFHNLFLPEPFLNNHLSFEKVTAGEVNLVRTLQFEEFAEHLEEVIDGSGFAAGSIIDDGMGIGPKWKFSRALTYFAVDLVNTDAEMLGEDIECTKIRSIPVNVDVDDMTFAILTRPESRGVVRDIFHEFANVGRGSVAAITGSPGIGKSWTLFYALQQALLFDGAKVLFYFQKASYAVLFVRRNNKMHAWSVEPTQYTSGSTLFWRSDVLVLLDPREAKEGGAKYNVREQKLLFAASNNEAHFTNSAEKEYGSISFYLGPPLDNELVAMLGVISPSLMPDVIDSRKEDVGNLIRYISNEKRYKVRVKATEKAVADCQDDIRLLEKALRVEGMSTGEQTIPGTLFQVLPRRPNQADVGYDGQGVEYCERVVYAANDKVSNLILSANRKVILEWERRLRNCSSKI